MSLMDGRLYAELALYYTEYKDNQISGTVDFEGVPIGIISNAGDAEIQGVDLLLKYLPTEDLELGFSGSYIETEFVKINATNTPNIEGDPLDLVAPYNYSLWADYSFDWFDGFTRFFTAGLQ